MFNATQIHDDTDDPYQGNALIVPFPLKLTAAFMQAAAIDEFIGLQNIVRPTMKKDYHLKERDAADLQQHLGERMPIIEVRKENGYLVGQCLLSFLKNHDAVKNLNGYPIEKNLMSTTAVVQSVSVHPSYQKRGISKLLLNTAFETAAQNGMTQIISAIALDNPDSIGSFESRGYEAFACGYDSLKGYKKAYFRRLVGCDAQRSAMAFDAKIA